MTTIKEILQQGKTMLKNAGSPSSSLDAEILLSHALSCSKESLLINDNEELSEEKIALFMGCIERRSMREPIAYIIGKKDFFHHSFLVNDATLIPRPDSEILVETVLEELQLLQPEYKSITLVDVGTGSGCLLLSILKGISGIPGIGIDISPNALKVAKANHESICPEQLDIKWTEGDLLSPILNRQVEAKGLILVVANLPYIDRIKFEELSPEIREFEPETALVSNAQGAEHFFRLIDHLKQLEQQGREIILHMEAAPYNIEAILEAMPSNWVKERYHTLAKLPIFARVHIAQ